MPHLGQRPGPGWFTSGCIGHEYPLVAGSPLGVAGGGTSDSAGLGALGGWSFERIRFVSFGVEARSGEVGDAGDSGARGFDGSSATGRGGGSEMQDAVSAAPSIIVGGSDLNRRKFICVLSI